MGGSPSPPPAPDPVATAKAQEATNKATAVTQYGLNATNQVTPEGSLSYKQIGTWGDGTPRFESTQTLSPEQRMLWDQNVSNQQKLGQYGGEQIVRIGGLLSKPVQLGNEPTEARLMELGRKRLDPMFTDRRSALEGKLTNQGVGAGTEAWNNAFRDFGQQENDAYNSLLLSGRAQGNQELLTERNQPINEISALMSGSQVSQPNWAGTPQVAVSPTDSMGAQNMAYQGALNNYNQQVGAGNAKVGGAATIGASAAMAAAMFF